MSFQRISHEHFPPQPQGGFSPGFPPSAQPPEEGYPPPPPRPLQPPYEGYQGYFNERYPPQPQPQPQLQQLPYHFEHSHYEDPSATCSSFLRTCIATLCCCWLLEECCNPPRRW